MEELHKLDHSECQNRIRPVKDALAFLSGKWKLPIILSLWLGNKRFSEISKEVNGITDRMLSKELRDLEINGLVKRIIHDSYPVVVEYILTDYGKTLKPIIDALGAWGATHRHRLANGWKQDSSDEK
ncbi:winged helix-turn-helix transcriptional regulator [Parapedobacter koreensis]|uniref:Transcriptional regulator, HxlR family n=1 Tax=Parapedobacter koreensis TaxID=332977 RepID=A0A1H7I7U5_9SPHI|nr:helix-turn-helix domain-containing protein [Parapedobacter koreensis]SEK58498.1 transcriptional regulator, HxlR family [Parapedobacter koreensis]